MRILILGGDGYLGWPQSLYLSSKGHDVTIFDNLMRRHFDRYNPNKWWKGGESLKSERPSAML